MTRLNNSLIDVDDAIKNRFYKYQIEMAEYKYQKGYLYIRKGEEGREQTHTLEVWDLHMKSVMAILLMVTLERTINNTWK